MSYLFKFKKKIVITTSVWLIYNKLLRANLILFYLITEILNSNIIALLNNDDI